MDGGSKEHQKRQHASTPSGVISTISDYLARTAGSTPGLGDDMFAPKIAAICSATVLLGLNRHPTLGFRHITVAADQMA